VKTLKKLFTGWFTHTLLFWILALAFFVRVYRTGDLLQFYYDQGRDALVIWDLWHKGKFFLIGPITGLKGIFLGPFYYYLIAPFYLLGGGNPVYPAVFLGSLGTLAVLMLYVLGSKMHSRLAGIIAATIGGFSYYIATFNRWLSNPNPILLTSIIFLWSLWEIAISSHKSQVTSHKFNWWWIVAALMVGVSLQFESASAIFYIPLFIIFTFWIVLRNGIYKWRDNIPNTKTVLLCVLALLITLLPQLAFNIKHENILLNNFRELFLEEKAFRPFTKFILEERGKYFWNVFSSKFLFEENIFAILFVTIAGAIFVSEYKKFKKTILPIFIIFLVTPMLGYILFQGNYGNIYDYYMSGYFLPFILLFSIAMGELWNKKLGYLIVIFFFIKFFPPNYTALKNYLTSTKEMRPISLEEQLPAVNWVFDDAEGRGSFNVDIYVPPVIPYAYDYLFLWQGYKRCGENLCGLIKERVPLLYTLYEPDDDHPERIEAWFKRQEGIGIVEQEFKYGHLTVQRRKRL